MILKFPSAGLYLNLMLPNEEHVRSPRGIVMVLGGRKPSPLFLRDLKDLGWDLWAVDKGIESCKKVDWQPSMALGDMDSVCSDALAWVRNLQIPMEIHPAEKDLTDFQLALGRISKTCTATQDVPVLVTGCFGGRLDHLVSSVMSFCYAPGIVPVGMVDQREMAFILKDYDNISLEFKGLCAPKNISLLPLEDCSGVSESGVKWELHDAFLKKSLPFAISNEPTSDKVRISLSTGILIVYLRW